MKILAIFIFSIVAGAACGAVGSKADLPLWFTSSITFLVTTLFCILLNHFW